MTDQTRLLDELGAALDGAKHRFDHADAPHDPDVLALIRATQRLRDELNRRAMPDPMPVFPLLGNDQLAPAAVNAYRTACALNNLTDQVHQVDLALAEMVDWQLRHPDLVKLPDHEHVPAARR